MNNPTRFILKYNVPFNFHWGVTDFDDFFHDPVWPESLKGSDPCSWTDLQIARATARRDHWLKLYSRESQNDVKSNS